MGRSQSKGAVFSIDALFASLAVLLILLLGLTVFSEIAERTVSSAESNEQEAKLLLLSDYLVKSMLAASDRSRAYQHQLDVKKLESLDAEDLAGEFAVRGVGVSLFVGGEKVVENGEGANCVRRVVWVPQYEEVGYLEACIE